MNMIFVHNWYYSSPKTSEENAKEAIKLIKQNITSFPFGDNSYEISSAEAKAEGDHYWLLLFLVSTDDSLAIREKIEAWLDTIGVARNDDRTTMTPKFNTLQECLENAYRGAYTLHTVINAAIDTDK